jgi:UDP-N-acetylglucosamine---dolichyl-phosphate N-acetylglucosaminyltransferase
MKHPKTFKVCIVMPAFNEASVIGSVITSINAQMKKTNYYYEIVVVNDGSKDKTSEISRKSGAKVIDHILNSGAGGATATGLSYAKQKDFDIAATMDSDGQHSPEDVLNGINEMVKRDEDLIIGSRLINSAGMSTTKIIGNKGLSAITYLLFGINSTDSQSGLRIYSKKALNSLYWKTNGYEFCSEMLWRAHQANLKVGEYPIKAIYTDYSRSKGQNNWNSINIVKSLVWQRIVEIFE